jgi:membrane-bound lytic murein transglycosylase B
MAKVFDLKSTKIIKGYPMKKMLRLLAFSYLIIQPMLSLATTQHWREWVADVRREALGQGVSARTFDNAFSTIHEPNRRVRGLSKHQPEHRLTFEKYVHTRASKYRILMGVRNYKQHKHLIDQIAQEYNVDPCFIVSFWGMETSYGTYMGDFPVIQSLATLAYDSNRKPFFRKQLLLALQILDEGHVSLKDYKGEWAGASGQPQFLPSSFKQYAVDYDGDGRKDIWKSKPDVFASIANYMKQNGWQGLEPWAIKVRLPRNFDDKLEGRSTVKLASEWNAMGIRTLDGKALPYQHLEGSIIKPYGGPTFLVFPNYKMILRYNHSIYYAGAIGYMADRICQRKGQ